MEKECPKCGNIVEGEGPKGDGVYIDYYCFECDENLEDMKVGECLNKVLQTRRDCADTDEIWNVLEFLADKIDNNQP